MKKITILIRIVYSDVSSFSVTVSTESNECSGTWIESRETKNLDFGIFFFDMMSFQGWPNFMYTPTKMKSIRAPQSTTVGKIQESFDTRLYEYSSSGKTCPRASRSSSCLAMIFEAIEEKK